MAVSSSTVTYDCYDYANFAAQSERSLQEPSCLPHLVRKVYLAIQNRVVFYSAVLYAHTMSALSLTLRKINILHLSPVTYLESKALAQSASAFRYIKTEKTEMKYVGTQAEPGWDLFTISMLLVGVCATSLIALGAHHTLQGVYSSNLYKRVTAYCVSRVGFPNGPESAAEVFRCFDGSFSLRSTQKSLKSLFRKTVRLSHPDKGGDETTMKAINAAYDILSKHFKTAYSKQDAEILSCIQKAGEVLEKIIDCTYITPGDLTASELETRVNRLCQRLRKVPGYTQDIQEKIEDAFFPSPISQLASWLFS